MSFRIVCVLVALAALLPRARGEDAASRKIVWQGKRGELALDHATDGSFQVGKVTGPSSTHLEKLFPDARALETGNALAFAFFQDEIAPVVSAIALLKKHGPLAEAVAPMLAVAFADRTMGPHGPLRFDLYVHLLHKEAAANNDPDFLRGLQGALAALYKAEHDVFFQDLRRFSKDDVGELPCYVTFSRGRIVKLPERGGMKRTFIKCDDEVLVQTTQDGETRELVFPNVAAMEKESDLIFSDWKNSWKIVNEGR